VENRSTSSHHLCLYIFSFQVTIFITLPNCPNTFHNQLSRTSHAKNPTASLAHDHRHHRHYHVTTTTSSEADWYNGRTTLFSNTERPFAISALILLIRILLRTIQRTDLGFSNSSPATITNRARTWQSVLGRHHLPLSTRFQPRRRSCKTGTNGRSDARPGSCRTFWLAVMRLGREVTGAIFPWTA
jgi:hypothetical protein